MSQAERVKHDDQLLSRLRGIVATIFDVPLEQVTSESSPETIEKWDSLGRLLLTIELEQEFGVQLTPEQTEEMTSIGAIAAVLEAQAVDLGLSARSR